MGKVIEYNEYIKNQDNINESPEATTLMLCDYIKYAVENVNLSKSNPKRPGKSY